METKIKTLFKNVLLTIASTFIAAPALSSGVVHFPINHGSEVAKYSDRYDGELVSVEVMIVALSDNGRNGQTYIKTEFPDKSEIWLAAIGKVSNSFSVGDVIHVLGYLSAVDSDDKVTSALNNSGWHIVSICYYNFRTKNETRFKFANEPNQCSDWRNGKIAHKP